MALLLRGSTFTLYGGSVLTRWIDGAVEQAVHVLGLAAVAAEQAMVAQNPQVARLGDRLVGRLGHFVFDNVNGPAFLSIFSELIQQFGQCLAVGFDALQQLFELCLVGLRHGGQWIEGREYLFGLFVVQIDDQDRHLSIGGCLGPQVAVDDLQRSVGQWPNDQSIDVATSDRIPRSAFACSSGCFRQFLGCGRRSPARTRCSSLIRSRIFMLAANPLRGFDAGQQDAEPEWMKSENRSPSQLGAENGGGALNL